MTGLSLIQPNMPFDEMNESDVRGEVLDPLLRRLGYSKGGEAKITREHQLKYPKLFLGRKKPNSDWTLQGIADYTLEVAGHARWTFEAKPPSQALDEHVLQQAWSYAVHPEVQSSYFAVSNGRRFEIYSTSAAWEAKQLFACDYAELDAKFEEIEAWLGPAQIARKHPNHLLSAGQPLGPNLRAFERVASGTISYLKSSLGDALPMLDEIQVSIVDGTIRRDAEGRIVADFLTRGPFRSMQERINEMGLQWQRYVTDDERLSVSMDKPTVFRYEADEMIPVGLNLSTFQATELPTPMRVEVRAKAIGHLSNASFSGQFLAEITFHSEGGPVPVQNEGTFEIRLG